jgi:phosphoribosylformimino-5-aminoimidazole carboxamide ribotide isomerase
MKVFPAIDIKNGKCVRLTKGVFDSEKIYNENPINQAEIFKNAGFKNLHIIDLDGALEGQLVNLDIIKNIIDKYSFNLEVGGGVRNESSVSKLIDIGVNKVILGTAAVKNKNFLKLCCKKFPDQIALALDVRKKYIAISGWKDQTELNALDFLQSVKNFGISRIIYTDIDRDGTHLGPNLEDSYLVANKINIPLVISGGVGSIQDVYKISNKNIEGVIVGKAIYENKINLDELSRVK